MTALADLTWPEAERLAAAGAMLAVPVGSTEQHGPHLPLSTDTDVAVALAGRLAARRGDVVVAPPVGYGSSNPSCAKRSSANRIGVRDTPRRTVNGCSEIRFPGPNSPVKTNSRKRMTVRSMCESASVARFEVATASVPSASLNRNTSGT